MKHLLFVLLCIVTMWLGLQASGYAQGKALSASQIDSLPGLTLFQKHYLNPFDRQLVFDFILPVDAVVTIAIYDAQGRKIEKIFKGKRSAGHHQIEWSARVLESGVYYCHFITPFYKKVEALAMLK